MTRKDYVLIAQAISDQQHWLTAEERQPITGLIYTLASALARDNPRFDRSKFIAACEPKP